MALAQPVLNNKKAMNKRHSWAMKERISSLIMWIMTSSLNLVQLRTKTSKRSRIGLLNKESLYEYKASGRDGVVLAMLRFAICLEELMPGIP